MVHILNHIQVLQREQDVLRLDAGDLRHVHNGQLAVFVLVQEIQQYCKGVCACMQQGATVVAHVPHDQ